MTPRRFETSGTFEIEEHVNLEECHRDPIHRTALIQPHGCFLEIDPTTGDIQSVSQNCTDHLGVSPGDLLSGGIDEIPDLNVDELLDPPPEEKTIHWIPSDSDSGPRIVHQFPVSNHVGLEIEPEQSSKFLDETELSHLNNGLRKIQSLDEPDRLYDRTVELIRDVIGYDRVMLYRFDEDHHGKVVAEDKRPDRSPYLGQKFPSSDIPEPARRLYRNNDCRYIPTIDYEPVPIVGPGDPRSLDEVDLTYSTLRNVPLVHRKYMKNMSDRASVSFSIMVEGDLWGLIACHNETPHHISAHRRERGIQVARGASNAIARLQSQRIRRQNNRVDEFHSSLQAQCEDIDSLFEQLRQHEDPIREFLDANGVFLSLDGKDLWLAPDERSRPDDSILEWVQDQLTTAERMSERTMPEVQANPSGLREFCGVLAGRIGEGSNSFIGWFRPEERQTVTWGGDPRNPIEYDVDGEINPRSSFEEWEQVVTNQSRKWTPQDQTIASRLIQMIQSMIVEAQSRSLRRYADNLTTQKDFLQTIVDSAEQAIFVKNRDGEYELVNKTFARILGVSKDEAIGQTDHQLLDDPDLAETFLEDDRDVIRSGESIEIEEPVTHAETGETRTFYTIKVPLDPEAPPEKRRVLGMATDITERVQMEQRIEQSLREKETLLKEVHHRVKNNMQVISSLLNLQSYQVKDESAREHIIDSRERVRSMALIHEKLYQSENLANVDLTDYLDELVRGLVTSHAPDSATPRYEVNIDPTIRLDLDQIIPLGLIVNEIVVNSLEHGFDGSVESPRIDLELSSAPEDEIRLRVSDNGVGLPEEFDPDSMDSLGIQLLNTLACNQLNGDFDFSNGNGTTVEVTFPVPQEGSESSV